MKGIVCHRRCANLFAMEGQSKPMLACQKPGFWAAAAKRNVVILSLKIAAVVGMILIAINQGDAILGGDPIVWWKVVLTFMVPYGVSTYSAAAHAISE